MALHQKESVHESLSITWSALVSQTLVVEICVKHLSVAKSKRCTSSLEYIRRMKAITQKYPCTGPSDLGQDFKINRPYNGTSETSFYYYYYIFLLTAQARIIHLYKKVITVWDCKIEKTESK